MTRARKKPSFYSYFCSFVEFPSPIPSRLLCRTWGFSHGSPHPIAPPHFLLPSWSPPSHFTPRAAAENGSMTLVSWIFKKDALSSFILPTFQVSTFSMNSINFHQSKCRERYNFAGIDLIRHYDNEAVDGNILPHVKLKLLRCMTLKQSESSYTSGRPEGNGASFSCRANFMVISLPRAPVYKAPTPMRSQEQNLVSLSWSSWEKKREVAVHCVSLLYFSLKFQLNNSPRGTFYWTCEINSCFLFTFRLP